ncbi:Asparagine synthetase of glutamine-hydrolyzing 2 [Spatholobus suberectus]|nr:Asparagine synthetase of glutamine-hydrolyzing 2 [Spatholobus suberectus]
MPSTEKRRRHLRRRGRRQQNMYRILELLHSRSFLENTRSKSHPFKLGRKVRSKEMLIPEPDYRIPIVLEVTKLVKEVFVVQKELLIKLKHTQAVIKRLMTDMPFSVLLSGGLDFSLVAAVTACYPTSTKAAKQWGTKLHSFCGAPDLKAAKEVAHYIGTVHLEFHYTVQDCTEACRGQSATISEAKPSWILGISLELASEDKSVHSRKLAGLILKNALDANAEKRKQELVQRWLSLDPVAKTQVMFAANTLLSCS